MPIRHSDARAGSRTAAVDLYRTSALTYSIALSGDSTHVLSCLGGVWRQWVPAGKPILAADAIACLDQISLLHQYMAAHGMPTGQPMVNAAKELKLKAEIHSGPMVVWARATSLTLKGPS